MRRGRDCLSAFARLRLLFNRLNLLDRADQAGNMHVEILAAIDLDRVAVGEILKTVGQRLRRRHHRVRNEHRD